MYKRFMSSLLVSLVGVAACAGVLLFRYVTNSDGIVARSIVVEPTIGWTWAVSYLLAWFSFPHTERIAKEDAAEV